jgi:hypothetical protein
MFTDKISRWDLMKVAGRYGLSSIKNLRQK